MDSPSSPPVLIVEDDPMIAQMLVLMLRSQGYQSLVAPDAASALQQLRSTEPALITLDLNLPGMSGAELLARLRAEPETEAIPVIIISACTDIAPAVVDTAQAVLCKPFGLEELITLVQATVGAPALLSARAVGA